MRISDWSSDVCSSDLLESHPFYKHVQPGKTQDSPDVVTLAKDEASPGVENEWHADITWHEAPSFGAVLRAVEIPPVGGDTLWADAAAAYDGLPEELQERIDGMVAVHERSEEHTSALKSLMRITYAMFHVK